MLKKIIKLFHKTIIPSRDAYIRESLPIADELSRIFNVNDPIVIFDIGSCEGEDSIRYAKMFPKSKIYAFEPLLKNIEIIDTQLNKYKVTQVTVSQIALSDEIGVANFYVSSGSPEHLKNTKDWDYGNKSSSLLEPDAVLIHYPWLKFEQSIQVKTNTITNFCNEQSITKIDFIHMDVQGAELKVLLGSGNLLANIKAIWLEIENVNLYKNQPLSQEMQDFMEKNGFKKIKDTVSEISGDHLYVRNY